MVRIPACLLLLCIAGPALAEQKLSHDFRGARFDPDSFRYGGPTPDKFLKPEADGLRLRYTGADVPPTNNPSGVAWRYHVRGNFVATVRYEILKCEPPSKGTFLAGVELYLRLDNPDADAVMIARGVYPDGSAAFDFKALTKDATGKRGTKDFKRLNTTEKSLRGRLRLAREGPIVTASFAAEEEAQFHEIQRCEIGNADIRLVRFAGIAGGDRNAVLDMRILEFQLEGEELGLDGRFAPPLPKHKAAYAREYYHSFTADREIGPEFHWHGLEPQGCVKFEPAGLRITLPAGHPGKRMGTGIGINTTVKGDFEITLRYEILMEPQDAEDATGLFVWVDLNKPKMNRGFVGRMTQQGKQFVTWYHLSHEAPEKPVDVLRQFPAKESSGRLRLVRTGPVLYHYVAEGADDEFRLLQQHPFGMEDLQAIRWGGQTGGPKASLEGRFLDVHIRADELPDLPTAPQPAPGQEAIPAPDAPRRGSGVLAVAVAGGLACALAFVILLAVVLHRRRRTEQSPARGPVETGHAKPQPAFASFPCPACGKNLKASARLGGKQVKCPRCGQAVQVPATVAGED